MGNLDWTSLVIGLVLGWLVLPLILSMLNSRRKTSKTAAV